MAVTESSAGGDTGGVGGGVMGGGGLGDPNTPSGQKKMKAIDQARGNVAASLKGGGTLSTLGAIQPEEGGRLVGGVGGSSGSFPVGPQQQSNPKNPNLWMGSQSPIAFMNYSDAVNMYYLWDSKTQNRFRSQLGLAGYDTNQMNDSDVAQKWAQYVGVSAQYQVAGKQISPWDVLGKDIAQRSQQASAPRKVTATQQTYNISTAEDAAALFQGASQALLGRDPTKAEQARFKSVLNKYEQANPSTTTTTSTYVGQDMTGQTSQTQGGVSAAAQQYIAQEEAKKDPEYGAFQAATNGMNWLMQMLGG